MAASLAVLVAAMGSPVLAADWSEDWAPDDFRGGYSNEPKDWSGYGDADDSLHFEAGLRYWYSIGSQSFDVGPLNFESSTTAHTPELHLRIDDDFSRTYAKAWAGYTTVITGSYSDPYASADVIDGHLGYAGADFGWNMFGDGQGNGLGGFVGYNFWNSSPRTGRVNFAAEGAANYDGDTGIWSLPGGSVDDNIDVQMLRLGLSGKYKFSDMFDITAEAALVPYASVNGELGGHAGDDSGVLGPYPGCDLGDVCSIYTFKGSPTDINGWGYGAMGEVMAGITPVENLTLRFGGRAWYVGGTYDASWREVTVIPPLEQPPEGDPPEAPDPLYSPPEVTSEQVVSTENPFSLFRYGILAELTYSF